MTMKRSAGETEFDSISSMASCLMLLSRGHDYVRSSDNNAGYSNRVFECKTCNRQFPSFQALGGHRASHKKPKTAVTAGDNGNESSTGLSPPSKQKTHECSICGLEFSIGQALGGHMRRHRAAAVGVTGGPQNSSDSNNTTVKLTLLNAELGVAPTAKQVPVVRKSNSRGVLWLDLNLTPSENDLKLEIVKPTTPLFCYL